MLTDMMKDELVKGLLNLFHENLSMIILYGSVARNEATSESDIDIAIITKNDMNEEIRNKFICWSAEMDIRYDKIFSIIDIKEENVHLPSSVGKDLQANCEAYSKLLDAATVDMQLLGIGANGHIGFNEPGTPFDSETLIVTLTEKTRKDNARFFDNDINKVPTHAITMGIKNIMNAKSVLLVASGSNKAQAIKNLMEGPVTESFPASALHNHTGKVIVVADEEACALLSK